MTPRMIIAGSRVALAISMMLGYVCEARAGTIWLEHNRCENGHNAYLILWSPPWSESLILLQRKPYPSGSWTFYAGYLAPSGCDRADYVNSYYRMRACTGSGCITDSNTVFAPYVSPCTDPP